MLIDTDVTKSIARRYYFPKELWKILDNPLLNTVVDGEKGIVMDFVVNVTTRINEKEFLIREVFLVDYLEANFILRNRFLRGQSEVRPFVQ